jgi:hypothetical protein
MPVEVDITNSVNPPKPRPPGPGIPSAVTGATAVGSLTAVAGQPAMLSNLAYSNEVANVNLSGQNAVANQQAMNSLGRAVASVAVRDAANPGPAQARSDVDVLTDDGPGQALAGLAASIASLAAAPAAGRRTPRPTPPQQPSPGSELQPVSGQVFVRLPLSVRFEGEVPDELLIRVGRAPGQPR